MGKRAGNPFIKRNFRTNAYKENDNLNVTVHDGKMVLEKAEKPKYLSFRERVEAFYGKPFEQVCLEREQLGEKVEEIDTGAPVGDEYW